MTKKLKGPFEQEIWNKISLLNDPHKWYHLNEIAKKCNNFPHIIEKELDVAVKFKRLLKKGIGRSICYKLNPEGIEKETLDLIYSHPRE